MSKNREKRAKIRRRKEEDRSKKGRQRRKNKQERKKMTKYQYQRHIPQNTLKNNYIL